MVLFIIMKVIAEEKYSPQRVRLLLPMHRLRHPKLTEKKNSYKRVDRMFLKRVARMFPQSVQRVDRVFLTRWDLSKGWQKMSLAMHWRPCDAQSPSFSWLLYNFLKMFSFHLQWRFSTCISFAIRSLWERISPRVKVPSTFLKILISIQARNFPVYSWKLLFLFKRMIFHI